MRAHDPEGNILQRHPAEASTPPAMAVAGLLCKALGVEDVDTIIYVAVLVAFVPTAVTFLVGLRQ
jgi:ABC-type nitrate/sulfonate/bicarbonate transport system permease component